MDGYIQVSADDVIHSGERRIAEIKKAYADQRSADLDKLAVRINKDRGTRWARFCRWIKRVPTPSLVTPGNAVREAVAEYKGLPPWETPHEVRELEMNEEAAVIYNRECRSIVTVAQRINAGTPMLIGLDTARKIRLTNKG